MVENPLLTSTHQKNKTQKYNIDVEIQKSTHIITFKYILKCTTAVVILKF